MTVITSSYPICMGEETWALADVTLVALKPFSIYIYSASTIPAMTNCIVEGYRTTFDNWYRRKYLPIIL